MFDLRQRQSGFEMEFGFGEVLSGAEAFREVFRSDSSGTGDQHRPLDHVFQFPDVSGPSVALHQAQGVPVESGNLQPASCLTLGTGGSGGAEGPIALMGAAAATSTALPLTLGLVAFGKILTSGLSVGSGGSVGVFGYRDLV